MQVNIILIILAIFFLILSFYFSSSESALFSIDEMRLKTISNRLDRSRIKNLLSNTSLLLIIILIGNNFVNIFFSSIMESILPFHNSFIKMIIITLILLIFGEITPKTIALFRIEKMAVFTSKYIKIFYILFSPLAKIIEKFIYFLNNILSNYKKTKKEIEDIDKNEISALLSIVSRESMFDKDEKELIERVLKFASREVWNIMTPRTKMVAVPYDMPIKDLIDLIKEKKLSKIPVYKKTDDNIIGLVQLPDIFPFIHEFANYDNKTIKDIMKPMYFVPETKKLSEMLEDFKKKNLKIAAVIDEYGSCLGIVTITDVLGEIVGELVDENFNLRKKINPIEKNKYIVSGDISLDDFNFYFKTNLKSEKYETIAGYIIEKNGDIPEKNFIMEINNLKISIKEKSEKHIEKFIVERIKQG